MSNFFYFNSQNSFMTINDTRDFVDVIEKWAHVIGVNLDRDPEQL